MEKWYDIVRPKGKGKTTKVVLYDEIGEWGKSSKEFAAELEAITTPNIDLHINSYGGKIVDGIACYNAIKNHAAKVTVHIDGLAASIASVIALAGDTVKIAKNAFVMVHNGWAMVAGDHKDLRKQADVLEKLTNTIAEVYADKTGKSIEECRKAMDDETWFDAKEAKAWGLVDEIDGETEEQNMASSVMLAVAKYQNTPAELRRFAARLVQPKEENSTERKEPKMEKIMCRDGKWFMADAEVDVSDVLAASKPDAKVIAQAREDGIAEGRKIEAEYRAMFNTVVSAAKLDATSAAEFEKSFYGRAEADLKFLASHAIGQRAKPLGEGAPGNSEGDQVSDEAKADKEVEASATKRFNENLEVRRMFGLSSQIGSDDPAYQSALKRYVARERQWVKDQKINGTTVAASK